VTVNAGSTALRCGDAGHLPSGRAPAAARLGSGDGARTQRCAAHRLLADNKVHDGFASSSSLGGSA
jgi:hypothetical protein